MVLNLPQLILSVLLAFRIVGIFPFDLPDCTALLAKRVGTHDSLTKSNYEWMSDILPLTILLTIFYTVINMYIQIEYNSIRHIGEYPVTWICSQCVVQTLLAISILCIPI